MHKREMTTTENNFFSHYISHKCTESIDVIAQSCNLNMFTVPVRIEQNIFQWTAKWNQFSIDQFIFNADVEQKVLLVRKYNQMID